MNVNDGKWFRSMGAEKLMEAEERESEEFIKMSETGVVKGFKVFNHDWTCRDKQYTCPGVFEEDVTPSVCNRGMHFCKRASDCFNYYSFNPENKVAEVIALTDCTVEDGDKCATKHLEIVREIPWAELLEIVNVGKACSGLRNSGNYNSGDCNSGDWNKCSFSNGCFNTVEPKRLRAEKEQNNE